MSEERIKSKKPINIEVKPRFEDESHEAMIKRFIKKQKRDKIIEQCRKRQRYKKPSEKAKEKAIQRRLVLARLQRERLAQDTKDPKLASSTK